MTGKIETERIEQLFSDTLGEVEFRMHHSGDNSSVTFMSGTKYFLRTNDYIGFSLMIFYDGAKSVIDFGRTGGGSGILGIRMGAGNKLEERFLESLSAFARENGYSISENSMV